MNVWTIASRLGRDSELRYTSGGDAIATFSVPAEAGFGDKKVTTWVNCSLFGKRAESLAPYLVKGQTVSVSGEGLLREWTDKEGNKRQSLELRVNAITLLGNKAEGTKSSAQATAEKIDDDIPW